MSLPRLCRKCSNRTVWDVLVIPKLFTEGDSTYGEMPWLQGAQWDLYKRSGLMYWDLWQRLCPGYHPLWWWKHTQWWRLLEHLPSWGRLYLLELLYQTIDLLSRSTHYEAVGDCRVWPAAYRVQWSSFSHEQNKRAGQEKANSHSVTRCTLSWAFRSIDGSIHTTEG